MTRRPRLMISTWSTVCATSASTWLETSTVRPPDANARRKSRSQRTPSGSRPFAGSSRISSSGSPSSAPASPSRWRMPSEYPLTRRLPAACSSTVRSTSSARESGMPAARPSVRRWSRPERPGWKSVASSTAPTRQRGPIEIGVRPAEHERPPARRRRQAEEHPQRGRLPRAVRAEKARDRPGIERERQIVDRENRPEPLRQRLSHNRGQRRTASIPASNPSEPGPQDTATNLAGSERSAIYDGSGEHSAASIRLKGEPHPRSDQSPTLSDACGGERHHGRPAFTAARRPGYGPPFTPRAANAHGGQHPRAARTPRRAPAPKRRSYMFGTA